MPLLYRIRISPRAARDLQSVFDFIRKESPQNAQRVIRKLLGAVDSLATLPHRYKVIEEQGDIAEEIRSMVERPYLIRYHIDDRNRAVIIHSVRHGARHA